MSDDNSTQRWRPSASDLIAVGALIAAVVMWLKQPNWETALPITTILILLVIITAVRHQSHPIRRAIFSISVIAILIWAAWEPIWNSFHTDYPNVAFQWPITFDYSEPIYSDYSVQPVELGVKQCSGVLHRENSDLRFGGAAGEGEGICVINKIEETKVLAICSVGRRCRVKGTTALCDGSGECEQIKKITSVELLGAQR